MSFLPSICSVESFDDSMLQILGKNDNTLQIIAKINMYYNYYVALYLSKILRYNTFVYNIKSRPLVGDLACISCLHHNAC